MKEPMTPRQWKALPELIRRGQITGVGIPSDVLSGLTVVVQSQEELNRVPPGQVAAWRLGGQMRFVKSTVTRLLGKDYQ